ncbi:MAG: hypothetical protein FJ030_14340 [Chloroflexi bacterium]|nr:hypothetical protein [Chloroflexota bacterium]
MTFDDLSREELIKLVEVFAKNWLAHDGCWFLAAEQKYGMEAAIELDARSWERFSPIEARRIMEAFGIAESGGLDALERALGYRLYSAINQQETERVDERTLRFRMVECRVQQARQRKGLAPFACKPVGLVEYTQFARTIDPRIQTACRRAPPDSVGDCFCEWEFRLD